MKPAFGAACVAALLVTGACWPTGRTPAQPAAPPTQYQALVRYRIIAPRDQHVVFYDRLVEHLQGLKFEFEPPLDKRPETDRIDPERNLFRGKIAAASVRRLRDNPQVAGVILAPIGLDLDKLPPDQPVRVRIELVGNLPPERQRELAEQAKLLLAQLGFQEAAAYDHRGVLRQPFTKLMGTVPAGQLPTLLKDLRGQPGGWFGPRLLRPELPMPLRFIDPVVYTEVLSDPDPIKDAIEPAARPSDDLEKIGPGLWELVNEKDKEQQLVRVQVLFAGNPSPTALRQLLSRGAPNAFIEGFLEPYVTAEMPVGQVKQLAAQPEVLAVRLPIPARGDVDPKLPGLFEPVKALQRAGLTELHRQKKLGQGVRLALLDTDFRGWEELVKAGKLPQDTRLIDLTAERSTDLQPAPYPATPALAKDNLGHGAQCAVAAALAAPQSALILIRIPDDEPYQILQVNQYLRGAAVSTTLERRLGELRVASSLLTLRRNQLAKERQAILQDFRDEEEQRRDFEFLGPVYGWIFSDRDWHRQNMAHQDQLERDLAERERRYWKLIDQIQSLKGIDVVAGPRTWNDGYPLGAAGPLSRAIDGQTGGPLWFQSAGNVAGQAWIGMFRDADGNGVMEFADRGAKLPSGRWNSELNFLAWQPYAGKETADLPEKAVLHITLQWREPHDPDYYLRPGSEDGYRRPLAELKLALLRQRDPDGKTIGADAFEIVARSRPVAGRLDHQPGGSVYEQVLDYTVAKPGRYALRIEHPSASVWSLFKLQDRLYFEQRQGLTATGIRPLSAPSLPGLDKSWELRPRLFVDAIDDEVRRQGRPVLADFATAAGALGMPGDARSVITVGAADWEGRPRPYSADGPPPFVDLASKPSIWAFDAVRYGNGPAWGTSLATSFAAGTAAALLSSGATRAQVLEQIRREPGQLFRVAP